MSEFAPLFGIFPPLFLDLLLTAVVLSSIAANVLTSFVILKYEKLRKEHANMLLLHLNIVECLFLCFTAISMWISILELVHIDSIGSCVFVQVGCALAFGVFLLLILITMDGCMATCSENRCSKFRRIFTWLYLTMVYGFIIAFASIGSYLCTRSPLYYDVTLYLAMFVSLAILAFVFVMNVIHRITVCCSAADEVPNNFGLAIANIFMLGFITVYPAILVAVYVDEPILLAVLMAVAVATTMAIPIIRFIYLFCWCDDFSVFLKTTFRCECNYPESEPLAEASVAYNDTSGVLFPKERHVA